MKKFLILCFAVLMLVSCGAKEKEMAIDFSNIDDQYVSFGDILADTQAKTVTAWINLDSFGDTSVPAYIANKGQWFVYIGTGSERLTYLHKFASANGLWVSPNNSIASGGWVHIAVSFDSGSDANNPVLYINGVSVVVTESVAPSGIAVSDAGSNLEISASAGSDKSPDGRISSIRIYNRILTADEVATIYAARGADNIRNGLVFCPVLYGAKGLQVFDGSTLSTANLIIDPCSGATGVPTGSPIAVGETYLRIKP